VILKLISESFVKLSAAERKDTRQRLDNLASSLKDAGIVEEARKYDAEDVFKRLQQLAIRTFASISWHSNKHEALSSGATVVDQISGPKVKNAQRCRGQKKASKRTRADSTQTPSKRRNPPERTMVKHNREPTYVKYMSSIKRGNLEIQSWRVCCGRSWQVCCARSWQVCSGWQRKQKRLSHESQRPALPLVSSSVRVAALLESESCSSDAQTASVYWIVEQVMPRSYMETNSSSSWCCSRSAAVSAPPSSLLPPHHRSPAQFAPAPFPFL